MKTNMRYVYSSALTPLPPLPPCSHTGGSKTKSRLRSRLNKNYCATIDINQIDMTNIQQSSFDDSTGEEKTLCQSEQDTSWKWKTRLLTQANVVRPGKLWRCGLVVEILASGSGGSGFESWLC